jgi:hypothetical protein
MNLHTSYVSLPLVLKARSITDSISTRSKSGTGGKAQHANAKESLNEKNEFKQKGKSKQ